jgi:hypothetical protein
VKPLAPSGALNLQGYYLNYGVNPASDIEPSYLSNNNFVHFDSLAISPGGGATPDNQYEQKFTDSETIEFKPRLPYPARVKNPYPITRYDAAINRGFMRLIFKGNLYHSEYSKILALRSVAAAGGADASATVKLQNIKTYLDDLDLDLDLDSPTIVSEIESLIDASPSTSGLPNPPYTPTFNSIELDYLSRNQAMEDDVDEFFYLHPFGGFERAELSPDNKELLPKYTFEQTTLFKDFLEADNGESRRAQLFLGFSGLRPGAALSMLVQTVEGSEKNAEADPPRIEWAYLARNNHWELIAADKILMDGTRGFTRSGIVQLSLPDDLSSEGNTVLDPTLHWLRVAGIESAKRLTAALPDLAYLHAQVVEARFLDTGDNEYSHLAEGMPAGSIAKLAISRSAIQKVEQPFVSFGGRLPETEGMDFYQRISERLRHRDRAVAVRDYEYLLLEAFPDVAAVKCIPHTQYKLAQPSELAPGSVTVAVIPDLKKRDGATRERPRFPKGDLDEMRDFLLERATLFLGATASAEPALYVVNAHYEAVNIEITVVFRPGMDEDFFKLQLEKDLHQYLSPWLSEQGVGPAFGINLRRSSIIHFVEELPYVKYIDVDTLVISKDDEPQTTEIIRPSSAHSILYSAAEHSVKVKS